MVIQRFQEIFAFLLLILVQIGCTPVEVVLYGDISGSVTDEETLEALLSVSIQVKQNNQLVDTAITSPDGILPPRIGNVL